MSLLFPPHFLRLAPRLPMLSVSSGLDHAYLEVVRCKEGVSNNRLCCCQKWYEAQGSFCHVLYPHKSVFSFVEPPTFFLPAPVFTGRGEISAGAALVPPSMLLLSTTLTPCPRHTSLPQCSPVGEPHPVCPRGTTYPGTPAAYTRTWEAALIATSRTQNA